MRPGKTASRLAGARRFDRGVEGEEVGLPRDRTDQFHDLADLAGGIGEPANLAIGTLGDGRGGGDTVRDTFRLLGDAADRGAEFFGGPWIAWMPAEASAEALVALSASRLVVSAIPLSDAAVSLMSWVSPLTSFTTWTISVSKLLRTSPSSRSRSILLQPFLLGPGFQVYPFDDRLRRKVTTARARSPISFWVASEGTSTARSPSARLRTAATIRANATPMRSQANAPTPPARTSTRPPITSESTNVEE